MHNVRHEGLTKSAAFSDVPLEVEVRKSIQLVIPPILSSLDSRL
jgi:hypothetical protein